MRKKGAPYQDGVKMRVGVTINPNVTEARELIINLSQRVEVLLEKSTAKALNFDHLGASCERLRNECDYFFSLGGDGTLLYAVKILQGANVPILSVNLGNRVAFLSEIGKAELQAAIEAIQSVNFYTEARMMLEVYLESGTFRVLNEVTMLRDPFLPLCELQVKVNGESLCSFWGDGIIVATPTGSTGYALSAGGPIVHPTVESLTFVPICPHTLIHRPIVLSPNDLITLKANQRSIVNLDGQTYIDVKPNQEIKIKKAAVYTKLIKLKKRSFYELIKSKFGY